MLDQIYCRIALQDVPGMVQRTLSLRSLTLARMNSSAEYVVYLREAAQCYVAGLPQAAIALSRAAVENRLKEICAKRFGKSAVETTDLKVLIDDVAARGQVLSKEGRESAHIVRRAANAVLHDEPAASDALAVSKPRVTSSCCCTRSNSGVARRFFELCVESSQEGVEVHDHHFLPFRLQRRRHPSATPAFR